MPYFAVIKVIIGIKASSLLHYPIQITTFLTLSRVYYTFVGTTLLSLEYNLISPVNTLKYFPKYT